MRKGIFKTLDARHKYMQSLGTFYAALGGEFGAYRTARPAFEAAKPMKLYERVKIVESDFIQFESAFNKFQDLRVAMQLEKARAQAVMAEIRMETDMDEVKVSPAKTLKELIALQEKAKIAQS
jgi:hypothetical protein